MGFDFFDIKDEEPKKEKKPLTAYQKFVQSESKDKKYASMTTKERMTAIGKAWKASK